MKNKQKWLWIISIIVIGIAAASCADDNVTPTHNHTWGEWSVTTAATCVAKGVETRACSGCTETQTQDIAINPNNHDPQPVEGEIEVAPTCTAGGFGKVACARTGCTHTQNGAPIDPLDHEGTIAPFLPTCITAGNNEKSGNCVRFAQCNHVVIGTVVGANGHTWSEWEETTPATCDDAATETEKCSVCSALGTETKTGSAALGHTVTTWTMKTAADCITSEIEEGTCTVCDEEDTRYSPTNHALGHTLNAATKQSVSFGVFEDVCTRCDEAHAHEFTYAIGDTGPAGGIIFYVADGEDGRPDGITIQGYGSSGDNGYFAEYTAYYLEAAPANETASPWGAQGTLIADVTTFTSVGQNNTLTIGVGRKDTQTIVNSAAFAALTNTAAQRCATKNTGGKTDWFLPSLGELNEMYKARVAGVTGIPTTGFFWSSSQANSVNAWMQQFANGNQFGSYEKGSTNVRAIRAF